jgi:hypothetical protein
MTTTLIDTEVLRTFLAMAHELRGWRIERHCSHCHLDECRLCVNAGEDEAMAQAQAAIERGPELTHALARYRTWFSRGNSLIGHTIPCALLGLATTVVGHAKKAVEK